MAAMKVTGGSRMRSLLHAQLIRTAVYFEGAAPIRHGDVRCASTKSRGGDKYTARLAEVQRLLYQAEERYKAGGGVEPIPWITLDHVGISYANTGGVGGQIFKKALNNKVDMRTVYPPLSGMTSMFTGGFLPRSSKNWVSKTQSAGNPRHKSSLVGTSDSETTRATTYPKPFCEWLAGIIDGDGSIQVSKKGYPSIEITVELENLRLLRYIQHMLGGSIKMRAGAKSYRYRLHSHLGMIKVMNCINGHIRHSARLLQLHRVCQVLEIPVILPIPLDAQSNWFAGFFDADGTITIDMKHELPQLSIQVTNKLLQDVEAYKIVFGGSLCFDSSRNGYYQWSIQSREDVIMMLEYFKSNTFRSHKSRRFFLIEEYYSLYDLEAFKPDSIHHKAWAAFLDKWNK